MKIAATINKIEKSQLTILFNTVIITKVGAVAGAAAIAINGKTKSPAEIELNIIFLIFLGIYAI